MLHGNSISQMIYLVVFVDSMWLWSFRRIGFGLDGFDRVRRLVGVVEPCQCFLLAVENTDRKSTRLNSSHLGISYAVFSLKKKNIISVARPHPNIQLNTPFLTVANAI